MKIINLELYYYNENFKQPIITPKITLSERKSLIIKLITDNNESYYGECNAFETNWYFDETIDIVINKIQDWYKKVQGMALNSFEEIKQTLTQLDAYPATRSTIVMACYQMFNDLQSLAVGYGATISGLNSHKYRQLVETQPERIKLKWSTHILHDLDKLATLPFDFNIAVDANESLCLSDVNLLEQVATYNVIYVEEPFKSLQTLDKSGVTAQLDIAIDEKALEFNAIERAIKQHSIKVAVLKPFRLGGIDKVMDTLKSLEQLNVKTVIGGMYEYGLSRYFTAMLAQYATYTSDITPAGFYFANDFVENMGILKNGRLVFNPPVIDSAKLVPIY
ncbi:o-succinylbenzoate synthase [Staphylococcus kloosii]|uniref:o-succinylbenzoate synthase n=1 Tax=Staphylococcus kloosii TaxID=29384 RepID=UPI0028A525AD|nr:o-succinylbenzoate synthase [Staphylococcus kloosii]MDT3959986.1 o-succinylbenzoate synthase [Staphylococcus kloosii]